MPLGVEIFLIIFWSGAMYLFLIAFVTIILIEAWPSIFDKSGFSCLTPKYLYKETKLNWFGAIVVGVLLNIIYIIPVLCWYSKYIFIKKEGTKNAKM